MHETTPTVFLLARPSIDVEGMRAYLREVGGESWLERRVEEAQSESRELGAGRTAASSSAGAPATAAGSRG